MPMDLTQDHQKLKKFFETGQEIVVERNETVIGYGEIVQDAYYLADGCIKVFSYTARENERIHFLYAPGDIFPVSQLFGNGIQDVGFTAFITSRLRRKNKAELIAYLRKEPGVSLAVLQQQVLMHGRIVNLNISSAEQRLADSLLTFSSRFGKREDDHYITNLPITTQQLGEMVRLTRETTGKVLAQFEREGYLIFGRRQMLIYPDKLKKVITG